MYYICRYCVFTWYGRIMGKYQTVNIKEEGCGLIVNHGEQNSIPLGLSVVMVDNTLR